MNEYQNIYDLLEQSAIETASLIHQETNDEALTQLNKALDNIREAQEAIKKGGKIVGQPVKGN